MCLKESCFPNFWKLTSVTPVWERSVTLNYCLVGVLSVFSVINEKLVNSKLVDHLEKCGIYTGSQYGLRSSISADLLTVVSERLNKVFNMPGATQTVALNILTAFAKVW